MDWKALLLPIITLVKVFTATCLGQIVVFGTGIIDMTAGQWKGVIAAGIAAVAMVAYQWAAPWETKYGIGSGE